MQNSFENDVRQKMEELQLTPSTPVWERIAVEIKAEKKKRRVIFWLLFAGLLLAGGAWFYQSSTKNLQPISKQTAGQSRSTSVNEKTAQEGSQAKKNSIDIQQENVPFKLQTVVAANTVVLHPKKNFATTGYRSSLEKATSSQLQKNLVPLLQSPSLGKEDNAPVDLRDKQTTQSDGRLQNTTTDSLNTLTIVQSSSSNKIDSATKGPEANETLAQPATDTALKKKIAAAKKWRKQFLLNTGWSNYSRGASVNYFPAANYASFPTQASGSAAASAQTTVGFSFSIGFSAAKKLGERWELTAGVQYAYASAHQKIGNKKTADTLVQFAASRVTANVFYTNAGTNNYTTRFHFVEIPVSLSFKPSLRLPLYVSVGAAYGRLLSTNALTFSRASNLYYRNKENDLRNTLPLFSSVQVEFFGKQKPSLRTGPFLQYNLLKLQKENNGAAPHLYLVGLKTAIIF